MDARIADFLNYIRYVKNYSQLTIGTYQEDLLQYETFVVSQCGKFDPLSPDPNLVRAWMAEMGREERSVRSIKRCLCVVRSFYKYLRQQNLLETNPMSLLPSPKVPQLLPQWIREEQMDFLLDEIDYGEGWLAVRDRLIIDLLYSTGIRRAEAASLQDRDIDFNRKTILVLGKGNKERQIPFGHELETLLQQYIRERDAEFPAPAPALLLNKKGDVLGQSGLYVVVRRYLQVIPTLSKKSPHVLRHSFATNMLNNGADLMVIKELLGHASLQSTEVYTHLTPQELIENYKQAHPRAINDKKKGD